MDFAFSLAGVVAGALITYLVNVRERRRSHVEALFNDAIAAVVAAVAAQEYVNNVPPQAGLPADRAAALEVALREQGYLRFVHLVGAAREAVARVVPYREDLRPFLYGVRGVLERSEEVVALLKLGRE